MSRAGLSSVVVFVVVALGCGGRASGGAGECPGAGACDAGATGGMGAWDAGTSGGTAGVGGSPSGGTASNTGGTAGTGGAIPSDAGIGGTGGTVGCTASRADAVPVPLDIYVMLDRSGSMGSDLGSGQTTWQATTEALTEFAKSPHTTRVALGLQFFPMGESTDCTGSVPPCPAGCMQFVDSCFPTSGGSCDLNDYLPPAVTIQALPGAATEVESALLAEVPGGGTPTLPALQSAVQATTAWAKQYPDHNVIILLATDGAPNDCNSDIDGVAAAAAVGASASPPVTTHVLGIGAVATLDAIAAAGGTNTALRVDTSDPRQGFLDALETIRSRAQDCSLSLPKPPPGEAELDTNRVNLTLTAAGEPSEALLFLPNAASCGSQPGWYYDDAVAPTKILLCPSPCSALLAGATLQTVVGCFTQKP